MADAGEVVTAQNLPNRLRRRVKHRGDRVGELLPKLNKSGISLGIAIAVAGNFGAGFFDGFMGEEIVTVGVRAEDGGIAIEVVESVFVQLQFSHYRSEMDEFVIDRAQVKLESGCLLGHDFFRGRRATGNGTLFE